MKCLPLLLILLFLPITTLAQPLEVVSSTPADGATGVPLETTVSFTFNRSLNTDAMLSLIPAVASYNLIEVDEENITFTNDNRTINVPVNHLESRDYSWTLFMALSSDNEPLVRPYVLNYTTEPSAGQHSVSGTVTVQRFSDLFGKRAVSPAGPMPLMRLLLQTPGFHEHLADIGSEMRAASLGKSDDIHDPTNTVIFLLEGEFDFDFDDFDNGDEDPPDEIPDINIARAGMVASPEGDYAVVQVRDGEYMPIAVRFRSVQPGFLFLDAIGVHFDEDGEVAPITVAGSSLTEIDITAFALERYTAHEAEAVARDFAEDMSEEVELIFINGFPIEPDGNAFFWDFTFYAPEDGFTIYLPVPFGLDFPDVVGGRDFPEQTIPIPDIYLDSPAAIEIAEANGGAEFRAEWGIVLIELEGGNLFWEFENPELEDRHVWKVQYSAIVLDEDVPDLDIDFLHVFLDMITGEVIDVRRFVSNEPLAELPVRIELMQNYPNPFNPTTSIPFSLSEPGHIQVEIFDVLGRRVATAVDAFYTAGSHSVSWNAEGVSSGLYVYRLTSGNSVLSRRMVVMK